MKFGAFNYSELNTALNVTMLERHLYDQIPGAWKKLGHMDIPAPIPKPIPRCKRSNRKSLPPLTQERNYVPGRRARRKTTIGSQSMVPETSDATAFTLNQMNKRKGMNNKVFHVFFIASILLIFL